MRAIRRTIPVRHERANIFTVIVNFVALALGKGQQPPAGMTYAPLLPLFLLLFTGLYLFVPPYAAKWRSGRTAG